MELPRFSDADIRQQFGAFLDRNGLAPIDNDQLILDGQIHRYRLRGDKQGQLSGAYCVYTDNLPAGWAEDWHSKTPVKWHYDISGLTQEQKAYYDSPEIKKKIEADQRRRKKEKEEKQIKASDSARIRIASLPEAPEGHQYLKTKQIYPYGIKLDGQTLAVPMRDINGQVKSLQWISPDGQKKMYPDAPVRGLFWSVGLDLLDRSPDLPLLLGEGFATMSKVYELTGLPCVAAFSCHALEVVAKSLKQKYPKTRIVVTADNDKRTELKRGYNPGIEEAQKLLKSKLAVDVIFPEFDSPDDGSDWDDYALKYGDDKAAEILKAKITWACMTEAQKKEHITRNQLSTLIHNLDPKIQLPQLEIIGGIFPRGYVSMIFAPPGTGKTIFIQKFASDLSNGGNIFDGLSEDEPRRTSLILAGEAGYELLIRRAAMMKWEITPDRVKVFDQYEANLQNVSVMLDSDEGWDNILRLIDMFSPDILFIDSLISFHEKDENKGVEIKPMLAKLAILARSKNIAIVPVHHSRKRLARERSLSLNQDDVIGSSVFNRYVGLIVGIEPMKDNESVLLVKPVKSWFRTFTPFTYTLKEGLYGGTVVQTDLAPAGVNNAKIAVWTYLIETFTSGEWFSRSQIVLTEIEGNVSERQVRYILSDYVKNGKLQTRGKNKSQEYSIV